MSTLCVFTQVTNRAFLFFTIPFSCLRNYMLSFSYASLSFSSVTSLLQFQIFCNIFSYLISPSHSSINRLTVCPSWLLVSHSAWITFLLWCFPKPKKCCVCWKVPRLRSFIFLLRIAMKMKMCVEIRWKDACRWKPKDWEKCVSQCHFVNMKYHIACPGVDPRPSAWEVGVKEPKINVNM